MEVQKAGTLESIINSLDAMNGASLVPPSSPSPSVVFNDIAVNGAVRATGHRAKVNSKRAQKISQFGILDCAVLSVSVVLLLVLFNECSTAFAYSENIKVGVKALDGHDVKAAKLAFSAGIMASPDSTDAHFLKALCNISDSEIDDSIKELDKAIELDHKNAKARLTRATLSLKKRMYHDAVKDCSVVLALNPADSDALRIRTTAYTCQQLFSKAIEDATSFLRLYPARDDARAEVLSRRAFALDQQHRFAQSIKDYSEAIKCDPKNEQYFVDRSIARMHDKQWRNAISDCNAALGLNSSIPAAYKVRGHCFDILGNHGRALKDFDKLVTLHSTIDTHRLRGNKRLMANDLLGSLEDFDYVLEQDPADSSTAVKYRRAKDVLQAKANRNGQKFAVVAPRSSERFAPIVVADKSDHELVSKGYELLMNGRPAEAAQYLQASLRSKPNNSKARRFLAYAFLESGHPGSAVEQFAAQEILEPLNRIDKLAYASALTKAGNHEGSLQIYSELLSNNAADDFARIAAIKLLLKNGEKEKARSLASTGMQVSPDYRKLYRSFSN